MELKQLRQVIEICKTSSFNKASQNLYISQPNLSVSIKNLESELENEIFTRTPKGVELTSFGREFVTYIEPICDQITNLEQIVKDIKVHNRITLSISAMPFKFIHDIFVDFLEKNQQKNFVFSYRETSCNTVLNHIENNTADIGFVAFSTDYKKTLQRVFKMKSIQYNHLLTFKPYVCVGEKNPFYNVEVDSISISQLADFPIIVGEEDNMDPLYMFEQISGRAWSKINVNSDARMFDIISKTSAFSFIAKDQDIYASGEPYKGIKTIPLNDTDFSLEMGWLKAEHSPLNEQATELMTLILETINSLRNKK